MLRCWANDARPEKPHWSTLLASWACTYNNTSSLDPHISAHALLFGRPARLPAVLAQVDGGDDGSVPATVVRVTGRDLIALQQLRDEASARATAEFNAGQIARVFDVGDLVRRRNPDARAAKTDPIWRFPYEIVAMHGGSNAHAVIKPAGQRAGLAAKTLRVRTSELAPYYHHQPELAVVASEAQIADARVKTQGPRPFAFEAGDFNLDAYAGAEGMRAMVRGQPPAPEAVPAPAPVAAPADLAAAPAAAPVPAAPAGPEAAHARDPAAAAPEGLRRSARQSHPPNRLTLTGSARDDRPDPGPAPEPRV
jgi:hypothetical protein